MANYPDPVPVSEVRNNFRQQLSTLAAHSNAVYAASINQRDGSVWYRPAVGESAGEVNVLDPTQQHIPFDRQENEEDFEQSVKDPSKAGTVGDLAVTQIQGELLASMERAFRSRHTGSCRARAHAAARRYGHGHENGVITQGLLGYVVNLDRLNKGTLA